MKGNRSFDTSHRALRGTDWLLVATLLMVCGSAFGASSSDDGAWLTDLSTAQGRAKAEHKLVLMDFTGSDWCHPCMDLHKNVLTSPEFVAYAKTNLVLVEVDFPQKKTQTEELKKSNEQLSQKFEVQGFPTVILLDPDGKQLSKSVGYGGETPKQFIAKLEKARKKNS
ncbi:MAG TPA: thioredoxin family protein [Verrucomicrobiae bacterium]|jgi:protein disulfide-isomerase|nr:thioredoxin family protein [Verrucomicrobiae bacterium]